MVLGCIEYSIEVAIPIPLAVKAYKERILSLNLKNLESNTVDPFKSKINNLNIIISNGIVEKILSDGRTPSIYSVIHFEPIKRGIITVSVVIN